MKKSAPNTKIEKQETAPARKKSKKKIVALVIFLFLLTAGGATAILVFLKPGSKGDSSEPGQGTISADDSEVPTAFYDNLTGEEIVRSGLQKDGSKLSVQQAQDLADQNNTAPTLCVQIPNGLDGARPHAGLHEAKIIFEAIAEAGITRFAAIYRQPTTNAIGPIRSLRKYYLHWDTPFDCTIVHAGGESGALEEVSEGYRHLTESTVYMWRTGYRYDNNKKRDLGYARPNNLFSDASLLNKFNADNGYTSSHPTAWPRLTPEESESQSQLPITSTTPEGNNEAPAYEAATSILIHYSSTKGYNPVYTYNSDERAYMRSYESGDPHTYYICDSGSEPRPKEDCGEAHQVVAKVVVVMEVSERKDAQGYREIIDTTGSGNAYVFQNGIVIKGKWSKSSNESQIVFTDESGEEIKLAPGQTWISAIPSSYGYVKYE